MLADWPAREATPSATVRVVVNQEATSGNIEFKNIPLQLGPREQAAREQAAPQLCLDTGIQSLVATSLLLTSFKQKLDMNALWNNHICSILLEITAKSSRIMVSPSFCLPNLMFVHPIGRT